MVLSVVACSGEDGDLPSPVPSSTALPYEDPHFRTSPEFEALPGATAHFGELNGGVFQIEVPDEWNGDLVFYFAGSHRFSLELYADPPPLRTYYITEGFAWATTSYNTNLPMSGDEAQQAAFLWDYFAARFGQPKHTFATGDSAGGDGVLVAVERYSDRFDGALSACGVAGVFPGYDVSADLLAAGAFTTGVSQAEYDAVLPENHSDFVRRRILGPINSDVATFKRFLAIWEELSGGHRPHFAAGYWLRQDIWLLMMDNVRIGLAENIDRHYELDAVEGIDEDDFNAKAIRIERRHPEDPGDPKGNIQAPAIVLHTTGDGIVPLSEAQTSARRVVEAGKGDLLAVRIVEQPGHCSFPDGEYIDAFESLVRWVRGGTRPETPYLSGEEFLDGR
jgi:acetyl esterase/lipase